MLQVREDGEARRDETVALGEADLEEIEDLGGVAIGGARHYQGVSLKGAIMATPTEEYLHPSKLRRSAVAVVAQAGFIFEPGRVSPVRLAAFSFFAGVAVTLLGVAVVL